MKIRLVQVIKAEKISKSRAYLIAGRIEERQGELERGERERDGVNILLRPFDFQVLMMSSALMDKTKLSAEVAVDRSIAMLKADESEIQEGNLRFEVILRRATTELLSKRAELSPEETFQVYQYVEEVIERLKRPLQYVPPKIYPLPDAETSSESALEGPVAAPAFQETQQTNDDSQPDCEEERAMGMSTEGEEKPASREEDESINVDPCEASTVSLNYECENGSSQVAKDNSLVSNDINPDQSELAGLGMLLSDVSAHGMSSSPRTDAPVSWEAIRDSDQLRETIVTGTTTSKEREEIHHSVRTFVQKAEEKGIIGYVMSTQPSDFLFASCCLHTLLPDIGSSAVVTANNWAAFVEEARMEINDAASIPDAMLVSFTKLESELTKERAAIVRALQLVL